MIYELNAIAYNTYLGAACKPSFKFELYSFEISLKKIYGERIKIWEFDDGDFWKCYNELENYVNENNIPKDKIEYPKFFKYIKL